MAAESLTSLFPIDELSIMGFAAVPRKLPMIFRRIRQATNAALAVKPDVLVIIDSPDFTQRVAKRVRARDPSIPIVDYVSPTVWAWRPGRARKIRNLRRSAPGTAAVRARGAPPARWTAVRLCRPPPAEQLDLLRPNADEQIRRERDAVLVVLPGSRADRDSSSHGAVRPDAWAVARHGHQIPAGATCVAASCST